MALPDISDYYDQDDNALTEHTSWLCVQEYRRQLEFIQPRFEANNLTTAIEFGPGSGLLAHRWKQACPRLVYTGIEKCRSFLNMARSSEIYPGDYSGVTFLGGDVRDYVEGEHDLALAFSFFKHFHLDEWDEIVGCVLASGRFAAFDMQVLDKDRDNGEHYPHVFVTKERLRQAVANAGHEVVEMVPWWEADVPDFGTMRNVAMWTRKV